MSILTTTAAVAATALVAAYGIGQITGPSISTEIEIAAPARNHSLFSYHSFFIVFLKI
jgi:hypothetical protein